MSTFIRWRSVCRRTADRRGGGLRRRRHSHLPRLRGLLPPTLDPPPWHRREGHNALPHQGASRGGEFSSRSCDSTNTRSSHVLILISQNILFIPEEKLFLRRGENTNEYLQMRLKTRKQLRWRRVICLWFLYGSISIFMLWLCSCFLTCGNNRFKQILNIAFFEYNLHNEWYYIIMNPSLWANI